MTIKPSLEAVDTIAGALAWTQAQLAQGGIAELRLESRLLVARAVGVTPQYVFGYPEAAVDTAARRTLCEIVARRAAREPMAYITGEREFWSLPFAVSPDTLIPRPDSETLIEAALELFPDPDGTKRILDLGTGSGCLLLALLHERRRWMGTGTDRSAAALDVARRNATGLGLADRSDFARHDWNTAPVSALGEHRFDLLIANPPYIPDGDKLKMEADVVDYEPLSALFAGADGLDDYRAILPQAMMALLPGGWILLEIGQSQHAAVSAMLLEYGFSRIAERLDLAGIPRCVFGCAGKQSFF